MDFCFVFVVNIRALFKTFKQNPPADNGARAGS